MLAHMPMGRERGHRYDRAGRDLARWPPRPAVLRHRHSSARGGVDRIEGAGGDRACRIGTPAQDRLVQSQKFCLARPASPREIAHEIKKPTELRQQFSPISRSSWSASCARPSSPAKGPRSAPAPGRRVDELTGMLTDKPGEGGPGTAVAADRHRQEHVASLPREGRRRAAQGGPSNAPRRGEA